MQKNRSRKQEERKQAFRFPSMCQEDVDTPPLQNNVGPRSIFLLTGIAT